MPCSISLMLTLTWGTDILFDKIRPETGGINLKNSLCTMPPSSGRDFMQSLSSFLIYLVVIRTLMAWLLVRLLGKIQFKRCCWCGDLTCTVSLSLGQVNRLGVKGNYVCCPVIVVIVIGLGGAKNYGGVKVVVWREAEWLGHKVKGGHCFMEELTLPVGILSELPTYFILFWSKKSYISSFLLKPH